MNETPDALLIPPGFVRGATLNERVGSVMDVAEPLLAVDRDSGERAYIRRQPGDVLFVTRDPNDTMIGTAGTPDYGRDRYRWRNEREDGIKLGYLK